MKYIKAAGAFAAIFIMLSLVTIHPVAASNYTKQTYTIDWQPYSHDYDKAINRAGTNIELDVDTWVNRPSGIYAGPYIPESELKINMVMTQWIEHYYEYDLQTGSTSNHANQSSYGGKVILAQKVEYTAQQIMSGASMFYVRLPINASCFYEGSFYILKSTEDREMDVKNTNSFSSSDWYYTTMRIKYDYAGNYKGYTFTDHRFNYDAGSLDMIAYEWWNTTRDTTISEEHPYVMNNRVYIPIKAPIQPDVYYTLVTVGYAKPTLSGGNTDIYISPDGISAMTENQAFIAYATDHNKDEIEFYKYNVNFSLGYSIIFNQGYGDQISAKTYYFEKGDEIYFSVDMRFTDESGKYATIMFPYLSDANNSDIDVNLTIQRDGDVSSIQTYNHIEGNDFILASFNSTVGNGNYWHVKITFNKNIRIGLFLSEPTENQYHSYWGYQYWTNRSDLWPTNLPDGSASVSNCIIKTKNNVEKNIFFTLFSPLQFGPGKWTYQIPDITSIFQKGMWYKFANIIFSGPLSLIITATELTPIGMAFSAIFSEEHNPFELAISGVEIGIYRNWDRLYDLVRDRRGAVQNIFDIAENIINAIGEFIQKVVYYILTAISWLAERIQYYGGIILEAMSEGIWLVMFFISFYLWYKFLQWMKYIAEANFEKLEYGIEKLAVLKNKLAGSISTISRLRR